MCIPFFFPGICHRVSYDLSQVISSLCASVFLLYHSCANHKCVLPLTQGLLSDHITLVQVCFLSAAGNKAGTPPGWEERERERHWPHAFTSFTTCFQCLSHVICTGSCRRSWVKRTRLCCSKPALTFKPVLLPIQSCFSPTPSSPASARTHPCSSGKAARPHLIKFLGQVWIYC